MTVLGIISPLIIVALIGYLCAKKQWLSEPQLSGISKLTFSIFIPAFLFFRMATADLSSQLQPSLFLSFYLPVLICFGLAWILNQKWHHKYSQNSAASAVYALGSSYSNTIIVGLPILVTVMGDKALPIIFLIVTFHSAMLFALTSALASQQGGVNWLGFIKQTLNNPLIIAILSGLIVNVSGLTLPELVAKSLTLLSEPAITLALFCLGASIAKYNIRGERRFIALACTVKLLLLPLLVFLMASHIFELDTMVIQVLVVLSACPTGVNAYLLAQMHKVHRKAVASTVVATTICSVVTIPVWMLFIELQ